MSASAMSCTQLAVDFLETLSTMYKLKAKKLQISPVPTNLSNVVHRVATVVRPQMPKEVQFLTDADALLKVRGRRLQATTRARRHLPPAALDVPLNGPRLAVADGRVRRCPPDARAAQPVPERRTINGARLCKSRVPRRR